MSELRYSVIMGRSAYELDHLVNERINNGWVPQGGVSLGHIYVGGSFQFAQAMIKPEQPLPQPPRAGE